MAIYNHQEITDIIIKNPNKELLIYANNQRKALMLQINGVGMDDALGRMEYHENTAIYPERKKGAVSNKDLSRRILGDEDQVFTARGGSAIYNISGGKKSVEEFSKKIANVRYGWSLHKWMQNMAINAYRSDPMGVIFVETEQVKTDGQIEPTPPAYPTYKSSGDIHDYDPNGRKLEYICFKLTKEELVSYGIYEQGQLNGIVGANVKFPTETDKYFRFVDDAQDTIYVRDGDTIKEALVKAPNKATLKNTWGRVPGFIASDLLKFDKPRCFDSPFGIVLELARVFLRDRSIRDLQKLFFGFAKAYEPLLPCPTCNGEGVLGGKACRDCTPAGYDTGTGWKMDTKLGDIAKFPIGIFKDMHGLKIADLFGYVTPDIAGWDKQDSSLEQLEALMSCTYWNTTETKVSGYNGTQDTAETATKTLTNLQPKYARLNTTADWAEGTERMIADLLGSYYYGTSWGGASISYGRGYILETPNEIFAQYQTMVTKGCPDVMLDEQFEKYIKCLYQNDPICQAKYLKLFEVEPFPHRKASEVEVSQLIPLTDKLAKVYFGEWEDTLKEDYIIQTDVATLRTKLRDYVAEKKTEITTETQDNAKFQASLNPKTAA